MPSFSLLISLVLRHPAVSHFERVFVREPSLLDSPSSPSTTRFGISPAPDGNLAFCFVPPFGSGFPKKNLPTAPAQRTGEILSSEPPQKDTPAALGAGTCAPLRAWVSRGRSRGKSK